MSCSDNPDRDDRLLSQYVDSGNQVAFARLMRRHLDVVYAAALRQVHEPHLAEDVTQAVFVTLHRKAANLKPRTTLAGWLMTVTRYAAVDAMRKQRRLRQRERSAAKSEVISNPAVAEWDRVQPLLDAALARLNASQRDAVVLRFFEDQSYSQIGHTLGISEDAARNRVDRGLQKLRNVLGRQGMTISAATLASTITATAATAPAQLVAGLSAVVAAPSATALSIAKGAITMMAWTKAKLIGVATTLVFLAAGGSAFVMTQLLAEGNTPAVQAQTPATQPASQPAATRPSTGPADTIDQVMTDMIDWTDGITAVLTEVKDQDSAQVAAKKLENAPADARALFARQKQLMSGTVDPTVQKAFMEKWDARFQTSSGKQKAQRQRINRDPALRAALGT